MASSNQYDKFDLLAKQIEAAENEEAGDGYPVPEADLLTSDTMEAIMKAKDGNKVAFESYWETDENDIDSWTKQQIENDPCKKFVVLSEEGKLSEMKLVMDAQDSDAKREKMLNYKDSDGYTALHRASYSNQLEVVKYLLSFEEMSPDGSYRMPNLNQLDARTDMGWTPLHSAAYWNSYQVVEYFITHSKVDLNAKSKSGQTPLHVAAQQSTGRETLLLLLTSPFVDFSIKNDQGETAADIARRSCKHHALFEIADNNLNSL